MWAALWKLVSGWFGGGGGDRVLNRLIDQWEKKKESDLERDRMEADILKQRIEAFGQAESRAVEIRKKTAGFWEMRLLAFLIAAPFVLHAGAVGIDTTFGFIDWGIPPYPPPFDEWEGAILLSFFGVYGLVKGGLAAAALLTTRR